MRIADYFVSQLRDIIFSGMLELEYGSREALLCDAVTVTVISVLAGGNITKFSEVSSFVQSNFLPFKTLLPTLKKPPIPEVLRYKCVYKADQIKLEKSFIDWTEKISTHFTSVSPFIPDATLDGEKPNRKFIAMVNVWKNQNPELPKIVRVIFDPTRINVLLEKKEEYIREAAKIEYCVRTKKNAPIKVCFCSCGVCGSSAYSPVGVWLSCGKCNTPMDWLGEPEYEVVPINFHEAC